MAKTVIINNTSFIIPEAGEENYADDLAAYLEEISILLNNLSSPLDILKTSFNFNNDTTADIPGFVFPTANVVSFVATYIITRTGDNGTITERGSLIGFHTSNDEWELSRINVVNDVNSSHFPELTTPTHPVNQEALDGDIGVDFEITTSGQLRYTSKHYLGQQPGQGTITFNARAIEQ